MDGKSDCPSLFVFDYLRFLYSRWIRLLRCAVVLSVVARVVGVTGSGIIVTLSSVTLLLSPVKGPTKRMILLSSTASVLVSFVMVNRGRSDSLNQFLNIRRSWKITVASATIFRSLAVATDCRHCCFICFGYWWMNFVKCRNNSLSLGRYRDGWYFVLYFCIWISISLISRCFHGC